MKFSSILAATALAACASAAPANVVANAAERAASAFQKVASLQKEVDKALLNGVFEADLVHVDDPILDDMSSVNDIQLGFAAVDWHAESAKRAVAVLATDKASIQAATDAAGAFNTAAEISEQFEIQLADTCSKFEGLRSDVRDANNELVDTSRLADAVSTIERAIHDLRQALRAAIESARAAAAACADFADAVAHADVDNASS